MNKKVKFTPKPTSAVPANADDWVSGEKSKDNKPEGKGPMKRLTLDISEHLHRRIKISCATRGLEMAEVMRELLEKEFPK